MRIIKKYVFLTGWLKNKEEKLGGRCRLSFDFGIYVMAIFFSIETKVKMIPKYIKITRNCKGLKVSFLFYFIFI